MKSTSEGFKSIALGTSARYIAAFQKNGINYNLPMNDFEQVCILNSDDGLVIGNACVGSIKFSTDGETVLRVDDKIAIYEGLTVSNKVEYLKIAAVYVTNIEKTDDKYTYTCYDLMSRLEKPYTTALTFPTTDLAILQEIATDNGVYFTCDNFIRHTINEAPTGLTVREVIAYFSALQGKNACISNNGNINFRWFTDTDYVVDSHKFYLGGVTFTTNNKYILSGIECTVQTDEGETTITAGTGYKNMLISNPFMTQEILNEVWSKIGGFEYYPMTVSFVGDFRLDVGDLITVVYGGTNYKIPLTKITNACDGGIKTDVVATGNKDTSEGTKVEGTLTKATKKFATELAIVNQAVVKKLDAEQLNAEVAKINTLKAGDAIIENIFADTIGASKIKTDIVNATYINAQNAELGYLTVDQLVGTEAIFGSLSANSALVQRLYSDDILTDTLDTKFLQSNFANIDMANLNKAQIGSLLANVGLITSAVISEGHVTGYLDAVEVNANKITAGTLLADRIIIKTTDGHYRLLEADGDTVRQTTLNGDIITERTISADHIVANTITTNEITTENLVGTSGWYNMHEGTMYLGNNTTGKQLSWDGKQLYINSDVVLNITDAKYEDIFNEMQRQISGEINVYTASEPPTFNNYPATDWHEDMLPSEELYPADNLVVKYTEEGYKQHLGDLIYVDGSADSYKFILDTNGNFEFFVISDSQYSYLLNEVNQLKVTSQGLSDRITQQTGIITEQGTAIQKNTTDIEANAGNIALKVSTETYNTDKSAQDKRITSVEGSLELKVAKTDNNQIVSMLNAAATEINLKGGAKINIDASSKGSVNISGGKFTLNSSNASIASDGTVSFKKGTIGGFNIGNTLLESGFYNSSDNYKYKTVMQTITSMDKWAFSIQKGTTTGTNPDSYKALWYINPNGQMYFNVESGQGIWLNGAAGTELSILRDGIKLYGRNVGEETPYAYTSIGKGSIWVNSSGNTGYNGFAISALGGIITDKLTVVHPTDGNKLYGIALNKKNPNSASYSDIVFDWDKTEKYLRIYIDDEAIATYDQNNARWI